MDETRQRCYDEIEAMAKAGLDRYYMEYPERLADTRSDDAMAWSLRGIHRVFRILDGYAIGPKVGTTGNQPGTSEG